MSRKLQILLIIVFLGTLLWLFRQVKKRKLVLRYALSWILLDIALLVLSICPPLLIIIKDVLGIYTPINMIFFCGFVFSLIIIYTLTVSISKMAEEIKRMAQKVALLEKKLSGLEEEKGE